MSKNSSRAGTNPKIFNSLNPKNVSCLPSHSRNKIIKKFTIEDKIKSSIGNRSSQPYMWQGRPDSVITLSSSSLREPVNICKRPYKNWDSIKRRKLQKHYGIKKSFCFYRRIRKALLHGLNQEIESMELWEDEAYELSPEEVINMKGEQAIIEFERQVKYYKNVS